MPDSRFYRRAGPFPLADIGTRAGATIALPGPSGLTIADVAPVAAAGPHDLTYVSQADYLSVLKDSRCGACLVKPEWAASAPEGAAVLTAADPRAAFAQVAALFYPDVRDEPGGQPAQFAPDAVIASTAHVGAGVQIGGRTRIGHNAVIGAGVILGDDCSVSPNVTLSHCLIGSRVIIHPGVQIGQDGFGFVPAKTGLLKMPQLGRVIIGDDVEIGANTTIDRGALEDTVVGAGTKIDNLVQIGHNVEIGRSCIIVSQVGISGSCRIGDGAVIGGQGGLADHVTVGAGAQIAAKSGVMRQVGPGEVVMGYPAKPIKQFWREIAAVSRLTKREK
jgi:UDP-3-O-[3-hydroxymyristoyl] glucosamine N-acyltransferase